MLSPCAQYSYIAGITEWKKGFATRTRMGLKRSRKSRCVCHLSELEMGSWYMYEACELRRWIMKIKICSGGKRGMAIETVFKSSMFDGRRISGQGVGDL